MTNAPRPSTATLAAGKTRNYLKDVPNPTEREKTLRVRCPLCTAPMDVCYDGTGDRWERSTELPSQCPKGHDLPDTLVDALHELLDMRARDGVGDFDPRELCGHDEAQR